MEQRDPMGDRAQPQDNRPGAIGPDAPAARRSNWWRRKRTPLYPQTHLSECGAASLGIILAHFGRWISLNQLRTDCGITRDGCTAADIVRAAQRHGLRAAGWRRELEQIRQMAMPTIIFWEFAHFMVLEGYSRRGYYVNDPATGRRFVDAKTFDENFTGVVLAFEPGPDFVPGGVRPGVIRQLWRWLQDQRGLLALAALAGLVLALPSIALAALVGIFVDRVLTNGEALGPLLAGATVALGALCLAATLLQRRWLRHAAVRASTSRTTALLTHLLRLPVGYFEHRNSGDLVDRVQSVDMVASSASGQFSSMAIELAMSLFMFAFMAYHDPLLALLVLALAAGGGLLIRVIGRLRLNASHKLRGEQARLRGTAMTALANLESLRANGGEDRFFNRFQSHLASELVHRQQYASLGALTSAVSPIIVTVGSGLVLGFGGLRVMAGALSVGELMALYVVAANFLRPVSQLMQLVDLTQMLDASLRRIADIEGSEADPLLDGPEEAESEGLVTVDGLMRLSGRVQLDFLAFDYGGRTARPTVNLMKGFTIEPGRMVALVGLSGCGKSTLARVIAGLMAPTRGAVCFDGRPRQDLPRTILASSVAHVDQQAGLFAGTVIDNLTMWDASVPEQQVVAAAKDAAIHQEILSRPLGYQSLVEPGGRNFSGGQIQRMEIARALVHNPTLLILDEATSALDAIVEERVHDAIRRRGCTCLIIAHRLSAIRDCDEILVMEDGRIRQRGRHEELFANQDGLYRRLIDAE